MIYGCNEQLQQKFMLHFLLIHSEKGNLCLASLFLNDWKIYIAEQLLPYDLSSGFPSSFAQIGRKDMLLKNEDLRFS
jgi:hypothetical protein